VRLFTREEAETLLPDLTRRVLEMQRCKREIERLRDELSATVSRSTGNGHVKDAPEVERQRRAAEGFVDEMNQHLAEIRALGVELKDIDQGLLDFPANRGGRVVYLCWKLGEESIGWWHEVDTGFAGRQPL
jgi:hypothetical protein